MANTLQSFAVAITPSDSNVIQYTPGDWFWVNCTVAGNVSVDLASGDVLIFRVEVGQSILALAVSRVNVTGTTATASYYSTRG